MAGIFTVTHIETGAEVDVFAVKSTFIDGQDTAAFFVYDIRQARFGWAPAFLFEATDGGYNPTARVSGVALDRFNITEDIGGSPITINATIYPAAAANKNVTWSISDDTYATISADGLECTITPVRAGRATVTCTTEDNNRTAECQVFILPASNYITSIEFVPTSMSLDVGESATLTALTAPATADNRVVSFSIVDGGDKIRISPISNNYITVTALEEGTAHIRATANDKGKFYKDFEVVVSSESTADVSTYQELLSAANNPVVDTINIRSNIALEGTISIARTVVLNGNNYTISYNGASPIDGVIITGNDSFVNNLILHMTTAGSTSWDGLYGLQIYNATGVHINTITSTGEDGGILINGSEVMMTGSINVSANVFGGIEVSRGSQASRNSILDVSSADLINTSEAYAKPTIWVENGQGSVTGANSLYSIQLNNQTQYYIDQANTVDPDEE